jgi:FkbM family methyltransferase
MMAQFSGIILFAIGIAVVVIVAALFLIRKAIERAFLAERQSSELELSELRKQLDGISSRIEQLPAHIAELSEKVELRHQQLSARKADLSAQFAQLSDKMEREAAQLSDKVERSDREVSARIGALSAEVTRLFDQVELSGKQASAQAADLSHAITTLSDSIETVARTPPLPLPADSGLLQMTEAETIALAQSIATLRPLVPYPKWRFDADWANPDRAFQLRQNVWQSFRDRASEASIVIGWHLGTRLQLHLGNDLSRQIYIAGCIDPNEFAFLDRYLQPGMTFFDAGANEGVYTVFAAQRVGSGGTVWAFEPSRREFERLRSNLDLNGLDLPNVRLFPFALADRSGRTELTIAEDQHAGQNTLGKFAYETVAAVEKHMVDVRRLDDLVAEQPPARIDVVKLDVEGAELLVLQGAVSTLERYRPIVLFEVSEASLGHQDHRREELLAFLREEHYSLYLFDDSGFPACAPPGTYRDNMLAVPQGATLPPAVFQLWPHRS